MIRLARDGLAVPVAIGEAGDFESVLHEAGAIEHMELERQVGSPEAMAESLDFAVHLLASGQLDGVVAGAVLSTADVIRAGLRLVGLAARTTTVSSAFYMVLPDAPMHSSPVLTFTDAGVVPHPAARQLAESAEAACAARRLVVGDEPRVAFLSYSTHGSAEGPSVTMMREALAAFRARCPEVVACGELQADAALVPEVARVKAPDSELAGAANILVFPDLDAGNIAYKLVERLAGAHALGPILQGLARPLNDLSRGASPNDIVHVACITGLLAHGDGE
jgi:phosphate acetyltransferase